MFDIDNRFDTAAGLAYLARNLEHLETEVRRQPFLELKSQELIAMIPGIDAGDEVTTHQVYTASGVAKFCASNATTYPMIDIATEPVTTRIHHSVIGTDYTLQELRAASKSNLPLDATRIIEMRHAEETLADKSCWIGDATWGVWGLTTHPNAIRQLSAYPFSGSTTAEQARATLNTCLREQIRLTAGQGRPNTMCMPGKIREFLMNIYRTTVGGATGAKPVLVEFLEAHPEIKNVEDVEWLAIEQNGTSDYIVFYNSDRRYIGQIFPLAFAMSPPQPKGVKFHIPAEMRHGGIKAYFPLMLNVLEIPQE